MRRRDLPSLRAGRCICCGVVCPGQQLMPCPPHLMTAPGMSSSFNNRSGCVNWHHGCSAGAEGRQQAASSGDVSGGSEQETVRSREVTSPAGLLAGQAHAALAQAVEAALQPRGPTPGAGADSDRRGDAGLARRRWPLPPLLLFELFQRDGRPAADDGLACMGGMEGWFECEEWHAGRNVESRQQEAATTGRPPSRTHAHLADAEAGAAALHAGRGRHQLCAWWQGWGQGAPAWRARAHPSVDRRSHRSADHSTHANMQRPHLALPHDALGHRQRDAADNHRGSS